MPPSEQDGMWQRGDTPEGWSWGMVQKQQAPTAALGLSIQAKQCMYTVSV